MAMLEKRKPMHLRGTFALFALLAAPLLRAQEPTASAAGVDTSAAEAAVRQVQMDASAMATPPMPASSDTSAMLPTPNSRGSPQSDRSERGGLFDKPDISDAAKVVSAANEVFADYMRESSAIWVTLKVAGKISETVTKTLDSLDTANQALATGEVPVTSAAIESARDYVTRQSDVCSALARRSVDSWVYDSGINSFQPSTSAPAQAYLDNWSEQLSSLEGKIEGVLPSLRSAESALEFVGAARVATGDTTAVLGDAMAISDAFIPRLGNCLSSIKTIRAKLREARSAVSAGSVDPGSNGLPAGLRWDCRHEDDPSYSHFKCPNQ
jgi:hypothetical protein